MRFLLLITTLFAASCAFATETVVRTVETSASPLQAYRAVSEDWIYKQWNDVEAASFGVAPESPWRIILPGGVISEGILNILEPGKTFAYSIFRGTFISEVRIDFEPTDSGTLIRVSHEIPLKGGVAMMEATSVGGIWDRTLPKLTAYLDSRPNSYLARPRGSNQYPAILLLHDRFGLTNSMRDFADSLALRGYVVLAVDMFKGDRTSDVSQARRFVSLVNEDEAMAAIGSCWRALEADSGVNRKRIGIVGIGFGGKLAMRAVAASSAFRCAAAWYPPDAPADSILQRIAAPLMIVNANPAGTDPTPQASAMSQRLVQQGVRAESLVIKGDDGFFETANGAAYSAAATTDAMRVTLSFLDRRLKL
ncbi:MAG: dienelactone hydrolase family protein [Calditrichaeota bacterium]|nr:dienelactone hydrolase family protein [Calditrichota bacterium]